MKHYGVGMNQVIRLKDSKLVVSSIIINTKNGSRTIMKKKKSDATEVNIDDFNSINLEKYSWIHFEGRTKSVEQMMKIVCDYNKSNVAKVYISVEYEKPIRSYLPSSIPYANLVIVSEEYAKSKGFDLPTQCVKSFLKQARKNCHVVCAWGSDGAGCGTAKIDGNTVAMVSAVPPPDGVVRDTLGAGDTFNGALINYLYPLITSASCDVDITEAVKYACQLAGYKVGHYGYSCIKNFN